MTASSFLQESWRRKT